MIAEVDAVMSTARVKSLLSLSTKCQSHIQAVGDMLLLSCTLRPVRIPTLTAFRNNYPKYRELIITRTKGLLVLTNRLNEQLYEANARWEDISQSLQDMDDLVVTLTECCAHAAYLVTSNKPGSVPAIPGIVDPYVVRRCSLEVNLSCQCLQQTELSDWTPPMLVDVCSNINKSLAILSDSFKAASEKSREKMISQQFKLCVKSMTTSASCFLSAVKCFKAQPTTSHYWQCRSFAEALASSTKAAVLFATEEQFIGKPAQLTPQADELRKTILGNKFFLHTMFYSSA